MKPIIATLLFLLTSTTFAQTIQSPLTGTVVGNFTSLTVNITITQIPPTAIKSGASQTDLANNLAIILTDNSSNPIDNQFN